MRKILSNVDEILNYGLNLLFKKNWGHGWEQPNRAASDVTLCRNVHRCDTFAVRRLET
jgi:hypothetical protein